MRKKINIGKESWDVEKRVGCGKESWDVENSKLLSCNQERRKRRNKRGKLR
jgi:hypothetical protein